MQAAFALLSNREVHNIVRKLAWELHQQYRTGTINCRLPPHISLKQPFTIADLAGLEAYMHELASTITPFEVRLPELQLKSILFEGTEFGLLWLDVQPTEHLRQLHSRLNRELALRFGNTETAFDGAAYHFHMTVTMGGQTIDVYRQAFATLAEPSINLRYTVYELALFVYDDEPLGPQREYITYKILPLGG